MGGGEYERVAPSRLGWVHELALRPKEKIVKGGKCQAKGDCNLWAANQRSVPGLVLLSGTAQGPFSGSPLSASHTHPTRVHILSTAGNGWYTTAVKGLRQQAGPQSHSSINGSKTCPAASNNG
jgi:hypothetical protein